MTLDIKVFVLFAMIFMHIVDDYYLQVPGILANMKQKDWWPKQFPPNTMPKMYKNDYKAALIVHAFSWSFMIHLPAIICYFAFSLHTIFFATWVVLLIGQALIHAVVDDGKANMHIINLCQDQTIHLCQILLSWAILIL